jgi:hypothetical protein
MSHGNDNDDNDEWDSDGDISDDEVSFSRHFSAQPLPLVEEHYVITETVVISPPTPYPIRCAHMMIAEP